MNVKEQIRNNWVVVALLVVLLLIIAVLSGFLWFYYFQLQKDYRAEIKRLEQVAENASIQAANRHDEIKLNLEKLRFELDTIQSDYQIQQKTFANELRKIDQKHISDIQRIHSYRADTVARKLSKLFSQF